MRFFLVFALFSFLFMGCDKPDPHPELLDPAYADLTKSAEELKKMAETEKANVEAAQKDLDKVTPQTGQIAYARKRLREAEEKARTAEQVARYYEVRAEGRAKRDRVEYLKSWQAKKKWPDPADYSQFLEDEKLQANSPKWDNKKRMAETGHAPAVEAKKGEEKKEAPKKEE